MADFIDREAFIAQKRELYCKDCDRRKGMKNGKYRILYDIGDVPCRACGIEDVLSDVEDFPSADVQPVGHAKWIETTEDAEYDWGYRHIRKIKCSCCGYCQSKSRIADSGALLKSRYCPVCGARMDLEDENG